MTFDQILELFAVATIVGLPMAAITFRLAARPIVDAIVRIGEALGVTGTLTDAERRQLVDMRQEMGQLRRRVAQLEESEKFYRSLRSGSQDGQTAEQALLEADIE